MRSSSSSTAANALRLWVLALCAAALSCAKTPTQIAFRVLAEDLVPGWCDGAAYRSDPRCPASAYRIEQILVRVCRGGPCRSPTAMTCVDGDLFCRTYVDSPRPTVLSLLPGDITVAPSDPSAGGRVGISVIATVRVPGAAGDPPTREYIPRRFVVPFVPETTQLVEVWLTSLCIGALCPPETTCGRRSCEREDSPVTRPFTPLPAPGPVDGGDRDVSFDVRSQDVAADTVDLDADAAPLDADVLALDADAPALDADAAPLDADVLALDADAPALDADAPLDADAALGVDAMDAPADAPVADGRDVDDVPRDDRADAAVPPADVLEGPDAGADVADACDGGSCDRIESIGAGGDHGCLTHAGAVWCWGRNNDGRLDAMTPSSARPSRVALPTNVRRVSVGRGHTCAWSPGGDLFCWGDNATGALGNGGTSPTSERVRATAVAAPRDVAAGDGFTCAVDGAGAVLCWGDNRGGQCGQPMSTSVTRPTMVPSVADARQVAVGSAHACALTGGGEVVCWGRNSRGQLGRTVTLGISAPAAVAGLPPASSIFVGASHSCATTASAVYCWGEGSNQRTGVTGVSDARPTPEIVRGVTPLTGSRGVAGEAFSCAITASREVRCWGNGAFGQLGLAAGPTEVAPVGLESVVDVSGALELAAGARHACARTDRAVRCWGSDRWGQLGRGADGRPRATPAAVRFAPSPARVTALAAGGAHACAIVDDAVRCWGAGQFGQLGHGRFAHAASPVAVSPPTTDPARHLCAGDAHTCAIYGSSVWCWGVATLDRLGVRLTATEQPTPVQVPPFPSPPRALACGNQHTCALLDDGAVHCWGAGNLGQLGAALPLGMTTRAAPAAVPGLRATAIAARLHTTCAARPDQSVACWGANLAGKLGRDTGGAWSVTPAAVDGVNRAAGVLAGSLHFCAWGGGGVQCWGDDNEGQLGQGATSITPRTPVAVTGLTGVITSASGGLGHTCVIHGGALSCWGNNGRLECGAATPAGPLPPREVALPAGGAGEVAAGGGAGFAGFEEEARFTCATLAREVHCWGSNDLGELGDGVALTATPADVVFMPP